LGAVSFLPRFSSALNPHLHLRGDRRAVPARGRRAVVWSPSVGLTPDRLAQGCCRGLRACIRRGLLKLEAARHRRAWEGGRGFSSSSRTSWQPSSRHRAHRHRYHGVRAPHALWRMQVTTMAAGTKAQPPLETVLCLPAGRPAARTEDRAAATLHRSYATSLGARRLTRIDEGFPRVCPRYGAPLRIIAFVTQTASVTHLLPPFLGTDPAASLPRAVPSAGGGAARPEPCLRPLRLRAGARLRTRPDRGLVSSASARGIAAFAPLAATHPHRHPQATPGAGCACLGTLTRPSRPIPLPHACSEQINCPGL
jgi:hypothetical protein